jgi:hypothetical protein
MNSAECGADAGMLFDEVYAALQIIAAEENVIEHGRHLINQGDIGFLLSRVLRKERDRRHGGSGGEL